MASASDTAKTAEDLKFEAANSNAVESPIPQLAANTNLGPEVPMAKETNPPAAPVAAAAPAATQPRNPWWIILAVLAVVAARFVLKRLLSRPRPP